MAKSDRRKERDSAAQDLNGLAEETGVAKVEYRAGPDAVADLYKRLSGRRGEALAKSTWEKRRHQVPSHQRCEEVRVHNESDIQVAYPTLLRCNSLATFSGESIRPLLEQALRQAEMDVGHAAALLTHLDKGRVRNPDR